MNRAPVTRCGAVSTDAIRLVLLAAMAVVGVGRPAAAVASLDRDGLYAVFVREGSARYIGSYFHPSIDPEGKLLYADNGQHKVVRWHLDALLKDREVFARPTRWDSQGLSWPIAAPAGGRVMMCENFNVAIDEVAGYVRSTVQVFDRQGHHLRGPIPYLGSQDEHQPHGLLRWRPNGRAAALAIQEGPRPHGCYVYDVAQNTWVVVTTDGDGEPRWSPDGKSLATIGHAGSGGGWVAHFWDLRAAPKPLAGAPVLRSTGSEFAYGAFDWIADGLVWPLAASGLRVVRIDGTTLGELADWRAGDRWMAAPAAFGSFGWAWSAFASQGDSPGTAVYWVAELGSKAERIAECTHGDGSPPVWDPDRPVLYVGVRREW